MNKEYYFIRHATPETDTGVADLAAFKQAMLGKYDPSLSDVGRRQALEAADVVAALRVDCLASSTLKRAMETAAIISARTGLSHDVFLEDLREFAPGARDIEKSPLFRLLAWKRWPGALQSRIKARMYKVLVMYFLVQWRRGQTTGGDSFREMQGRIRRVLETLDTLPAGKIAIVGHGYWIMFLALHLMGNGPLDFFRLSWVANCSVTRVDSLGQGRYSLRFFAQNGSSLRMSL